MNAYEYAIARVATQIRKQREPITDDQLALFALLMDQVERYKREGK